MTLSRRLFTYALPALALARPAWAQAFTMQLTTTASNDFDVEWLTLFKQDVEAASKGQIRANVYPGSQLGSGPSTVEGVAMGTIEVAMNASGTYEALDPRYAVFAVPGLFDTMAQGQKLLTSPEVRARVDQIGRDKGVETITALVQSPAAIVTRRPVKALADLTGMKIRVPGSASLIEQLKKFGAAPIAMSLGEVLPAFQNGTIDGVYAGTTIFTGLKYYDISKNLTLLPRSFLIMIGIVNAGFMSGLGKLEPVVRSAMKQADTDGLGWAQNDVDNAEAIWTKNGGQVFNFSDDDKKHFLDVVVPAALNGLSPAAKSDYAVLKAAADKGL